MTITAHPQPVISTGTAAVYCEVCKVVEVILIYLVRRLVYLVSMQGGLSVVVVG